MRTITMLVILPVLAVLFASKAGALDNGLARTPPMGWLVWERFMCNTDCKADPGHCLNEQLFLDMGTRLSQDGWVELGYNRVNLDDCWSTRTRDKSGNLVADPERFPHGIQWLAEELNKMGVKLGIYEDYGTTTCQGYPGLIGHIQTDVDTFARWGVDMLKVDGCHSNHSTMNEGYPEIGRALNKTGRPILYSCSWPYYLRASKLPINYTYVAEQCNIWRNYNDIDDSWVSVTGIIDYYAANYELFGKVAGPGNFNDPDQLIIGDFSLSYDQSKAQMAIWCVLAAPLFMSNDLRNISDQAKEILQNKELLAVNQDPLGVQGQRYSVVGRAEYWMKPLQDGSKAVVMFNRTPFGDRRKMTVEFKDVGFTSTQRVMVRDLYLHSDTGVYNQSYSAFVNPAGGVVALKLSATTQPVSSFHNHMV